MSARMRLIAIPAVVAAAAAVWWLSSGAPQGAAGPAVPAAIASPAPLAPAPAPPQAVAAPTVVAPLAVAAPDAQPTGDQSRAFRSDTKGRLVVDERTRLAVEKLVALNGPTSLQGVVSEQTAGLPAEAAAQVRDLVERYGTYESARRATFQPGTAPLVPEDGLSELAATSAMRTSYFGQDAAQRMFGAEEAVTKRLLELMRDDRGGNLTIEQKALRAQARYSAEHPNR